VIPPDWAFAPAIDQAEAIRRKEVRPIELLELYYRRISQINPKLNAYVLLTEDLARSQAEAAEHRLLRAEDPGRLGGVPISIKETASLAGYRASLASKAFEQVKANVDGFPIGRLKAEGAVILGKTNAPEFGTRPVTEGPLFPPARNPYDRSRTAGGSTGGGGAAVASGLCALAQGGDGGGSIRIPAACCGVVGLKPSRGRISSGPILGEDWAGLVTAGVLARNVADSALGLDSMAGHLPGDPYWADQEGSFLEAARKEPGPLRVGWTASCRTAVDPEQVEATARAAKKLEAAGHQVFEATVDLAQFSDIIQTLAVVGVGSLPIKDPAVLDPLNAAMFRLAPSIKAVDYLKAITRMHIQARQLVAHWDTMDVLLTPTLTGPAVRIGELGQTVDTAGEEFRDWLSFLYPFNCTGQPAISIPAGLSESGLPLAVQLVGRPHDEYTILSLATQLESLLGVLPRPPEMWSSPVEATETVNAG
jgi:amidase